MTATPLRPPSREELGAFARRGDVLVASDFDGVLAPFVLDPMDARAQPGTLESLTSLAALPATTLLQALSWPTVLLATLVLGLVGAAAAVVRLTSIDPATALGGNR